MSGTSGSPRAGGGLAPNGIINVSGDSTAVPKTVGAPPHFVTKPMAMIASTPLEAAGAFLPAVGITVPLGTRRVTFWIGYTRGAVGGFPVFRVISNARAPNLAVDHRSLVADLGSFVATGQEGATQFYTEEILGPPPDAATILRYTLTYEIPAGARDVKLAVAERGVPATPGTIIVFATSDG